MLGVVNLEQNNIIKLFSVMAVVLMPPTLIASIYGMNFKIMPELEWTHGYPLALVMMVLAAVLPYMFYQVEAVAIALFPLSGTALFQAASISLLKFERWAERLSETFLR